MHHPDQTPSTLRSVKKPAGNMSEVNVRIQTAVDTILKAYHIINIMDVADSSFSACAPEAITANGITTTNAELKHGQSLTNGKWIQSK